MRLFTLMPKVHDSSRQKNRQSAQSAKQDISAVGYILKHAASHKLLSQEEERELAEIYVTSKKQGATKSEIQRGEYAKKKLISSNIKLVISIAKKRAQKAQKESAIDLADLIQEGVIGLNRAIERFDPSQGWRLSTYAYWFIRQNVWECAARLDRPIRVPLYILERASKAQRIIEELSLKLNRKATFDEVAEQMKTTPEAIERYLFFTRSVLPLDKLTPETVLTAEISDSSQVEEKIFKSEEKSLIKKALAELPENMQFAIIYRFGLYGLKPSKSYTSLGNRFRPKLSEYEAKSLIDSALILLRQELKSYLRIPTTYEEDRMAFKAYLGTLDPLEKEIIDKVIQANKKGLKTAKELVHVDAGELKETIKLSEPETIGNGNQTVISITAGNDDVNYAHHHEFVIQPFLRPGLETVRQELKKISKK